MRFKLTKKILISLGIILAAFLIYAYAETYWIKTSFFELENTDIPSEFIGKKIVFASDFHCGIFFDDKRLLAVVDKINALNPDIIILGGDYADYDKNYIDPAFDQFAKLKAGLGIYAILGNRDYKTDIDQVKRAIKRAHIKLLENQSDSIAINGSRIRIGGVADFLQGKANERGILANVQESDFLIFLTHNPTYIERIDNKKIDLVLSGHTHGGQVTLFGAWLPFFDIRYGHKYQYGAYQKDNTSIIVSSGIGTRLLPFRFYARPEINIITLAK